MSITLTPQQEASVRSFKAWFQNVALPFKESQSDDPAPFFLQHGFAGTGKSTILPFFISETGLDPNFEVTFCAPTGKAAKVMTKKLREQGINAQAITIHKAMYRPKGLKFQMIESQMAEVIRQLEAAPPSDRAMLQKTLKLLQRDLDRAYSQSAPSFSLDPEAPMIRNRKLIVVDEASMVGQMVADDMLSFGTPVLAIGDPGQLQPVGDAPGFFVRAPDHILTEIHRQALENPIIWASKLIRDGEEVPAGSHGGGLLRVLDRKSDDVTYDTQRDVQIIVGTNKTRHKLTRKLRQLCGLHAAGPSIGEMMIVTKNSRKHPSLVNGTMMMVTSNSGDLQSGNVTCKLYAKDEEQMPYELTIIQGILEENYLGVGEWTASKQSVRHAMERKENHTVDWAYAITCHKSQGSQWNDVCVHDESGVFRDQQRQWLYTAVTRAAETLTIIQ